MQRRPESDPRFGRARRRRTALLTAVLGAWLVPAAADAAIQASFDCSPSCAVAPGTSVTFTSTSTSDTMLRQHIWDLDGDGLYGTADEPDEPSGLGASQATRVFATEGDHTVGLRVTNATEESTTTRTVTVRAAPPPPAPPPPPEQPIRPTPPAPDADADRDGVADTGDLCPLSLPAARPRYEGCAMLDLVASPGAAIADAVAALRSARRGVARQRGMAARTRGHSASLERGIKTFKTAAARLAFQPCIASAGAARGLRTMSRSSNGFVDAGASARLAIIVAGTRQKQRRPAKRDADALATRIGSIAAAVDEIKAMVEKLRGVMRAIDEACRASLGTRTIRARVVSVDPAGSHAMLSNGTTLVLGAATKVAGLATGVTVSASGSALKRGILVAKSVKGLGIDLTLLPGICTLTTTIAPVQDFTQGADKVLHYDERGYLDGGTYRLEGGMGIGAQTSCPNSFHTQSVALDYTDTLGSKVTKLIGVLGGRPQLELPARLPLDVAPGTKATLRFELYELECELIGTIDVCAKGQLVSKRSAPAEVRPRGGWGEAQYDSKRYSVEDGSQSDFAVATLTGVKTKGLAPQGGPYPGIFGVGYGVNGNASTRPQAQYILEDQQFALHDRTPVPPKESYFDGESGIPGGLLSAYVHGNRGGHVYHYVATLPNVVTDVVSVCSPTTFSFYRLPWDDGTIEQVTQGNETTFTHSGLQAFAFDFVMENHEIIHAARGGVVEWVEESLSQHSDAAAVDYIKKLLGEDAAKLMWKAGNELKIRHQDNSISFYTHMQKNGVFVSKDAFVKRGATVAKVGNTGNTTGPHLHFHAMNTLGVTIRARFELATVFSPAVPVPCVVPSKGAYVSTNG